MSALTSSSSPMGAIVMGCETRRRKEGVAKSFFELLGGQASSSSSSMPRLRLPGVVMKASR